MRSISASLCVVLAASLWSCNQGQPVPGIDPKLGRACFERHRASLPPGAQYEGMESLVANRLSIKVMNGVDIVQRACVLTPDGEIQNAEN